MGRRAGKIGTTLDYSSMYDQLKIELSGAPHDIKVEVLDNICEKHTVKKKPSGSIIGRMT